MMKQNINKKGTYTEKAKDSDFNAEKFLADTLHHDVYIEKNADNQLVYKVEIIVGDFKPNEIKLKLKGKKLIIHAIKQVNKIKYELRCNDTQQINYDIKNYLNENKSPKISNLREHEEFKREIVLPNFVIPESIVSFLETYEDKSENTLLLEGQIDETKLNIENNQDNSNFKYKVIPSPFNDINNTKTTVNSNNYNNKNETNYNNSKNNKKKTSSSDESSIEHIEENNQLENYSNGCLKYKFDLRQYDSHDINISIKNKEILVVTATNENNKFCKELKLPKNSEIHNIRNCFDEATGLLRIEIPLKSNETDSADAEVNNINNLKKSTTKSNTDDKYLELVFDLHDFKFDQIDVQKNDENKNILIVKALRLNPSILNDCINNKSTVADTISKNSFVRKYILPDWVSTKNIKVYEEKKIMNDEKKNLLVLHIPFI